MRRIFKIINHFINLNSIIKISYLYSKIESVKNILDYIPSLLAYSFQTY